MCVGFFVCTNARAFLPNMSLLRCLPGAPTYAYTRLNLFTKKTIQVEGTICAKKNGKKYIMNENYHIHTYLGICMYVRCYLLFVVILKCF